MDNQNQQEITSLAIRAKDFYKEVEKEIMEKVLSLGKIDSTLIIGLDPKGKRYWIGETESSILEQRKAEGNENLVYFTRYPLPTENSVSDKLFITV